MRASFQSLAFFGLAAVNAAPLAQTTNWNQVWSSEMASMASVQSAMGGTAGSQATATSAGSGAGPTVTGAVAPTGAVTAAGAPAHTGSAHASSGAAPSSAASSVATSAAASSQAAPSASSSASSSSGGSGSGATVTNQQAFSDGAASKTVDTTTGQQVQDGTYNCYGGSPSDYPDSSKWGSFDNLWTNNQKLIQESCTNLGDGADPTPTQISMMKTAITQVAGDSFVDARFILAIMLQESHGCVNVGSTNNGVTNPGIMQSHNGVSYSASDPQGSITQMVRDGTQGTSSGDGLVQLINKYGNIWSAARAYNSGSIASSGDLNNGNGATASYVNDIANRLTGWSMTPGTSKTCSA